MRSSRGSDEPAHSVFMPTPAAPRRVLNRGFSPEFEWRADPLPRRFPETHDPGYGTEAFPCPACCRCHCHSCQHCCFCTCRCSESSCSCFCGCRSACRCGAGRARRTCLLQQLARLACIAAATKPRWEGQDVGRCSDTPGNPLVPG